jgi:hypothetical protein
MILFLFGIAIGYLILHHLEQVNPRLAMILGTLMGLWFLFRILFASGVAFLVVADLLHWTPQQRWDAEATIMVFTIILLAGWLFGRVVNRLAAKLLPGKTRQKQYDTSESLRARSVR